MAVALATKSKPQSFSIENPGALGWLVVMTASLYFFYEFIQMNMFNSLSTYLMAEFHLNATQLGSLSGSYFYTDALFVIPAGLIIDRLSPRILIVSAMLISSIAAILFGLSHSVAMLYAARLVTGACAAFCFLSVLRIATRWFPPAQLALVIGFVVTWAMLGGMVAQTPFSYLIEATSWRTAVILDGVLGLAMMFAILFIVRDYPPNHSADNYHDHNKVNKLGLLNSIKLIVSNPQNWICGLYTTLLNLPIFILGAVWGIMFVSQVHHLSALQASYATAMLFFGTILGCPAFGMLSDNLRKRRLPMILGAILSIASVLCLMEIQNLDLTWIIVLFFSIGFFTSAQIISYPVVSEVNPHALTGSATSIVSVCIMVSGFIAQPLFGSMIRAHWHNTMINGTPLYSRADYHHAMFIMPISFAVALVLSFFIKETHCKQVAKDLKE